MSVIHVKDRGGQSISLLEVGDVRLPTSFPVEAVPNLPKLKMRDDDVIIAAWLRSGTHWMWEMVSMLLNNNTQTIPKKKEAHMLEYATMDELDRLPSRRVLNTHFRFHQLPEDLKTKRCQVIYLLRDPRDVTVSYYKLMLAHAHYDYKGQWHDWLPVYLEGKLDFGTPFDHVRDWEKVFKTQSNLDVCFWFYENMKKNPVEELRKVAEFLGTNTDESLLAAIVEKCQLDRMREDKYPYEWLENGVAVHYMKGQIGSWKELFTVEEYEVFEKIYRQKMAGSQFEARYRGPVEVL